MRCSWVNWDKCAVDTQWGAVGCCGQRRFSLSTVSFIESFMIRSVHVFTHSHAMAGTCTVMQTVCINKYHGRMYVYLCTCTYVLMLYPYLCIRKYAYTYTHTHINICEIRYFSTSLSPIYFFHGCSVPRSRPCSACKFLTASTFRRRRASATHPHPILDRKCDQPSASAFTLASKIDI